MSVPTSPYLDTSTLAMLQKNLLKGLPDFTADTAYPKTTIERFILWVGSQIENRFREAGYVVPFQAISGETWPTGQTYYLELLVALGVSSLMSTGLKPAPATGPGSPASAVNDFTTRFDKELDNIYNQKTNKAGKFRAAFYLGTPAEKALTEPSRPKSDWLEGYIDKTKYQNLTQYTTLMDYINTEILAQDLKWDYAYDLLNMGLDI